MRDRIPSKVYDDDKTAILLENILKSLNNLRAAPRLADSLLPLMIKMCEVMLESKRNDQAQPKREASI